MKLIEEMDCPFCDGKSILTIEPMDIKFRGNLYRLNSHFYKCNKCNEEFTELNSDTATINQLVKKFPDYGKE